MELDEKSLIPLISTETHYLTPRTSKNEESLEIVLLNAETFSTDLIVDKIKDTEDIVVKEDPQACQQYFI